MGPAPHKERHYCIGSNFWKFYLIRTGFTLCEPVSFVKVFRLLRSELIFLVFRVWTQWVDVQHLISSIGRASVFVMPCFFYGIGYNVKLNIVN